MINALVPNYDHTSFALVKAALKAYQENREFVDYEFELYRKELKERDEPDSHIRL